VIAKDYVWYYTKTTKTKPIGFYIIIDITNGKNHGFLLNLNKPITLNMKIDLIKIDEDNDGKEYSQLIKESLRIFNNWFKTNPEMFQRIAENKDIYLVFEMANPASRLDF
jgi:hypothetical protein